MTSPILAEAYQRLHHAGPEWNENSLTNHGPMAVEVLVRRGHEEDVHPWVDGYLARLDHLPHPPNRRAAVARRARPSGGHGCCRRSPRTPT